MLGGWSPLQAQTFTSGLVAAAASVPACVGISLGCPHVNSIELPYSMLAKLRGYVSHERDRTRSKLLSPLMTYSAPLVPHSN